MHTIVNLAIIMNMITINIEDLKKGSEAMFEIIQGSSINWGVFWGAVEAIATAGALVFLLFELPKIRRDAAARKVEGLKYAIDQLQANDFQSWCDILRDEWKKGNKEYPQSIDGYIVSVLFRLDYVGKLAELGYVDKDLLFYTFSYEFPTLEANLRNLESRDKSQIPNIIAATPYGYNLLKESSKSISKERGKLREKMDISCNEG